MKKKIIALLACEHAALDISHVCRLYRFSGDVSGVHRDNLTLEFFELNGNARIHAESIKIESRDPEQIILFCADMMETHFAKVARQIATNIRNGYNDSRNCDVRSL